MKALTEMGVDEQAAETEARACGSSASVWRVWNQLDHGDPSHSLPVWAQPEHAAIVVPAVLIGAWSEQYDGDKDIVSLFSGCEYETYRDNLQQFLSHDDPLIVKIDDTWAVSAPATAFAIIVNNITTGHLKVLENALLQVFEEIDPTIDMPPDERPYAAMKNAALKHSTWLRDGLAGSLLRIVVLGNRLEEHGIIPHGISKQDFVDNHIRKLLGLTEDWRLIASLRYQLPVLAEAGPNPFMEALDRLLQGNPEELNIMFEEGGLLSSHSFMPNLLWALETLAWEPSYLARVSVILTKLASVDPGGRSANRPINSLKEIFLAWHPGTSANHSQRLDVLDMIISTDTVVGWCLIKELLPESHAISSPTSEPIWRNFSRSEKKPITRGDVWYTYSAYVQKALTLAGDIAQRWSAIIDVYADVSEEDQLAIENSLSELSVKDLNEEDRHIIWSKLRETISKHREYPDASWSLPEKTIARIETLQEIYKPSSIVDQLQWLFDEDFPDIGKPKADFDEVQKEINSMRIDAVKQIISETGKEGLIELIKASIYPGTIAKAVLSTITDIDKLIDLVVINADGEQPQRIFSSCLSAESLKLFNEKWADCLQTKLKKGDMPIETIVTPYLYFPDTKWTFDLVEGLGEEFSKEYWLRRSEWIKTDDGNVLIYILQKMMEHGRSIEIITIVGHNTKRLEKKFGYLMLNNVLKELNEGKSFRKSQSTGYWLEKIFEWLREGDIEDKLKLARLEYAFLPIFSTTRKKGNLIIHKMLAEEPNLFVDILCDLYKPENRDKEQDEPVSEKSKDRAHIAWNLLHNWKLPPGVDEKGNVDTGRLNSWVDAAREIAKEKDRLTVAEQHIGNVLYHIPADHDDGEWPHIALRDLLDRLRCKDIEIGIEIEQHNSRGTVTKAMFEGGDQERHLSKLWKERANILSTRWTRISALCERIAMTWERDAAREDERAEKDRLRYQ